VIENAQVNTRTFLPTQSPLVEIFQDMYDLSTTIDAKCKSRPIWKDALFAGMHVMPLIYRLLTLPRIGPCQEQGLLSPKAVIQEACRLASLLYLCEIRRCFAIAQIPSSLYVRKLYNLLAHNRLLDWDPYNVVYLWVLLIGGICAGMTSNRAEERFGFVQMLVRTMQLWNVHSFEEVIIVAERFLWINDVFGKIVASFQQEIEAAL